MFVIGMAYRGTANNGMLQKLLHFAVSDVSDDVRRAAVLNLGFLLLGVPDQCPPIVSLLAESYNPNVRYGKPQLHPRLHSSGMHLMLGCTAQHGFSAQLQASPCQAAVGQLCMLLRSCPSPYPLWQWPASCMTAPVFSSVDSRGGGGDVWHGEGK